MTTAAPEPLAERLYLSAPDMRGHEIEYVTAALESGWIAPIGPDLTEFEAEISKLANGRHAVGTSSGTAALQLALQVSGVQPGDDVLCSTLTFVATANAVVQAGGRPVMVDSDLASWNMDPVLLAEELERRAKTGNLPAAVVTVDLYGQCCTYDKIVPVCAEYQIPLIEDAAEALGATYKGKGAGSFGKIAIFSFNGNKIITSSGGGMLVTPDPTMADRVRYLATQARQPAAHYEHTEVGYNYRLSNILAALGRAQLRDLDARVLRRREFNKRYREALGQYPGVTFMPEAPDCYSTFWLTCLTIDPTEASVDRETVRLGLAEYNVESRPVWKPMHRQPVFADAESVLTGVSDQLFADGLCLPSGSGMTDAEFEFVVDRIVDIFESCQQWRRQERR